MSLELSTLATVIPIALLILFVIMVVVSGYVKAPTNEAFIISGFKKEPRVLIGRAGIKIPFLERKDTLIIKQISIDIKTNGFIPTEDFIGVDIDAIAKVHLITEKDVTVNEKGEWLPHVVVDENTPRITYAMATAAMKNFLNMNEEEINAALTESLQGNMREIIGTQTLKSLCNDRKGFGDQVQEKAQKDMNTLGVFIASCNIQKITDKEGLIIALGQDNMSKIQKDASIAKAQADSEVAIAEAAALKASNDAEVAAETEIARKQNELEITKANLQIEADRKRAEADAAYKIQEQEQRRSIEIANANADIARQEREIELKEKEVAVKEQELNATIRKKAEAEKYAKEQAAEADLFERKKRAEAELFEKQKEAEGIRSKGLAEAEAIKAKALAEAEGIEKKAEAMRKMGEAAILEMYFNAMPDIAKNIAEPLTNVDRITMYGDGNTTKLMKDIMGTMTQVTDGIKESTGIDLAAIIAGFAGGRLAGLPDEEDANAIKNNPTDDNTVTTTEK